MAKKNLFWAAIMVIVAAFSFVSCEGSLDELNDPSHNAGYGIMKVAAPDDKIVDVKSENLKMRFVGDEVEYSFTHVDVYRDGGPIDGKKVSETYGFVANGTEPQYFDGLKTFEYVTNSGRDSKSTSESKKGDWEVTLNTLLQPWNAANKAENHNFDHQAEGSAAAMVYSYYDEELGKGYAAKFPAPSLTISGEQLSNERVSGVVYNGKVYEAIKYSYAWTVTATIPEAYRIEGEKYEDTREGVNVAFFLLHEVETKLEDNDYTARFYEDGANVLTDIQQNKFNIVTYDNGEVVEKVPYKRDLNLYVRANTLNDIVVGSEETLKSNSGRLSTGTLRSDVKNSNIFTQTTYTRTDTYTEADGQVITLEELWQKEAWGSYEFPYASIASITANTTTVRNANRCTNTREVYTVTTVFTVKVKYNGVNKADETYSIVVSYDRIYNIPDNIETKDENMQYVIVTKVSDSKDELIATEQFNAWNTNTYNRGVVISSEAHKVDLPLSAKTANGSSVSIKKEQRGQKVSVRAIDEGTASTTDSKVEGEDYTVRTTTRTATYTMSDGGKLPVTLVYGRARKGGKDVLAYTEVKNLRVMSVETPVKNEDLSSGENEVYDVKVNFAVDLEEKGSVQTRASGDVRTEYLVANYQQTIGDELVPGSEEFILTGTKNGQAIDWKAEGFETWTLRGRIKIDEKSGKITPSLTGKDYDPMVVSNTNFKTSGNGHNGTGNGTYSNNASNGVESFVNEFGYNAPASFDVTLNFTSGAQTKQVATSFVIREGNAVVGAKSGEVNGYDVYPYASTVNGTFSALNQTVELTATDNRQLRVKKATDDVIRHWGEGTSTPNGDGFDLTARFYEERKLSGVQLLKTMTGRMEGSFKARSASDVYADNANFQTTSNGKNGSTSGTYSSTASNGAKSQNNIYDFSYDDVKVLSYNGDEVRFTGSASFAEVSSTIGNGSVNGNYTVYPYTNKAQMVYTVDGKSVTLTDQVKWNILVARPIDVPDLVPGKIKAANITVVPANGDNASNYADGSNKRNAIKTLCIVTDEGAEAVAFAAWNNENVVVPTNNEIKSGNFVSGNYSTAYNSGYYQSGKWVPAIAKDNSWGISYSIPTQENIRSIRNETLKQWNWRNGNYSVFVDGYTFDVDANGVLTVRYKGEVVLQCK